MQFLKSNPMPIQNYPNTFMSAWTIKVVTCPIYSLTSELLISYPDFFSLILAIRQYFKHFLNYHLSQFGKSLLCSNLSASTWNYHSELKPFMHSFFLMVCKFIASLIQGFFTSCHFKHSLRRDSLLVLIFFSLISM